MTLDDLLGALWGDEHPHTGRGAVRNYLHRLRRVLGAIADEPAIVLRGGGYVLRTDELSSDVARFRHHVRSARRIRRSGGAEEAASELRLALGEWQGQPLGGARGAAVDELRDGLERERVDALELLAEIDLELGRHAEAIDLVTEGVRQQPFRERLHEFLMLALCRSGRQAEALVVYDRLRRLLADELGVEPSSGLRAVYADILRADGEHDDSSKVRPAQLPIDLPVFVGRETELAEGVSGAVTLVHGMPGVGKTAFAVHLSHQVSEKFPDGQLYINLRGFGPDDMVVSPEEALRTFLEALGVSPAHTPEDVDGRSALYRSVLSGRRLLVVLDNARDAEQVLPLLPGGSGCHVLITSRNELLGLITATGARTMWLDVLDDRPARELFTRRIGPAQANGEPNAVAEIIALCARLPLALAVVSARAATHPRFSLSDIAEELRRSRGGLDGFRGVDPMTDVRSVLSWSYRALSTSAARLLRLLSLHPGTAIGLAAAASLAGGSTQDTTPALRELTSANLVVEERPGRYSLHDLVHTYASELRKGEDEEASVRLRDHYLQTAYIADEFFSKADDKPACPNALPGVSIHAVTSHEAAVAWFNDERVAMLTLIERAPSDWAWRAAWTMRRHLDWGGYWEDLGAVSRIAERQGSAEGRAYALRGLARVASQRGNHDAAVDQLADALHLFRQTGNETAMAYTHRQLAGVLQLAGRDDEAIDHSTSALELFHATGGRAGEGGALVALAWALTRAGRSQEAIDVGLRALPLVENSGETYSTNLVYQAIGRASHQLGQFDNAISYREKGMELMHAVINTMRPAASLLLRTNTTLTQINLSAAYRSAGRLTESENVLREALGNFRGQLVELQRAVGPYDTSDQTRTAALWQVADQLHPFVTEKSGPGWYDRARTLMVETIQVAREAGIEVQTLDAI
ncbi:BTAD domain-containing putative transcriptional regulator [Kutzneria sp. NPDC051319]|uniref:AfsR/SARP family transcriptional regulator n=1 Tax=Kutzneria sp. NPDC051319 TaxID=3155047 RepID=UPI003434DD94